MNEPIRILMLFTIMNRGGAETMVMNYYRRIDRTKVQFDFMVHRQERGAYDDEIEALGGRIFRMMPLHPLTFGKYRKQIAAFFDAHPDEYRIIHGHCSESGYFVYKEAARRGVPVIVAHAHNSYALFDAKWFFRMYFKTAMRKYITQGFVCGKEAAEWLLGKKLAASAILQRNAIDTAAYRYSSVVRSEMRQALGIPQEAVVVGHVGRFDKQKNHPFLLDIFGELARTDASARLLLVGTGEGMEAAKRKVERLQLSGRVLFLGTRADVPQLLSVMDVFLFPSFMEGLSVAMVEAQCAGLPCVVSDTIPREVAMTDRVTFLPLEKSAAEWARQIAETVRRTADRTAYPQQIAEAGYDIVRNAEWLQHYYLEQWKQTENRKH